MCLKEDASTGFVGCAIPLHSSHSTAPLLMCANNDRGHRIAFLACSDGAHSSKPLGVLKQTSPSHFDLTLTRTVRELEYRLPEGDSMPVTTPSSLVLFIKMCHAISMPSQKILKQHAAQSKALAEKAHDKPIFMPA